jgi:peptidyl-prolyl cis-trans isomerase SurA
MLGVLLATGLLALTACQPSAGTAAYIGSQRVTDDQLQDDVAASFATPKLKDGVDQQYGGDLTAFRRQLLSDRVRHELVTEAVRRTGVQVTDADVTRLIDTQGGFDRARDDGHFSPELATRHFKDLLLMAELGYTKQGVKRPTEADLRAAYTQEAASQTTAQLGLIQVPDQNTLTQVITQLTADPTQFDAVAAKYEGSVPAATPYPAANIPETIRARILAAKPGTILAFAGAGQAGEGQFLAVKVYSVKIPTFEELRLQLSLQSLSQAYQAGQAYVAALGKELGVRVSPRYGTWNNQTAQVEDAPNPLVSLTEPTPTAAPTATVPAAPGS